MTPSKIDFDRWARTYDATRGASPSVLHPLLDALGPAAGRAMLDIGGGTGNFAAPLAASGFAVTLSDLSPAMAVRARAKIGGRAVAADAQALPFRGRAFDCAISVNVLRHIPDRHRALSEARRVIRDGPFVIKVSTEETQRGDWLLEYFPRLLAHQARYQPESEIVEELHAAGFPDVRVSRFLYKDVADGSFQAIKRDPALLLDDAVIMNTAVFQRLPAEELSAGLAALRSDISSGNVMEIISRYEPLRREYGDGSIFIASP